MSLPVPIGETLPWYANEVKIFLSSITAFAIALLVTTIIVGHPTKTWIVSVGVLFVVYASFMITVVVRGARYRRRIVRGREEITDFEIDHIRNQPAR